MNENKKSYYAVIPATVRYDKRLKPLARLLYGELTALSNEKGYCWASNKYFAELYEVTSETVSRWISQLAEYGYIRLSISRAGKMIVERKIYLSQGLIDEKINTPCQKDQEVIDEKINTPIDKKVKENNTDNNTTENNTLNRERTSRFTPPSEYEVAQYITELKNSGKAVDFTAEYFINNNAARGWMIGKNKMKDWKAAVRTWISRDQTQTPKRQQYPSKGEQEILDQYLRFPTNDDLHKYLENPYNRISKEHLPTLKKFRGFEL